MSNIVPRPVERIGSKLDLIIAAEWVKIHVTELVANLYGHAVFLVLIASKCDIRIKPPSV